MNYKEMKKLIEQMANENHKNFVKSLISFEKNIHDEEILDRLYDFYMDNDSMNLISDEFDDLINKPKSS